LCEIPHMNGRIHGIAKRYDKDNIVIDSVTLYKSNRTVLVLYCDGHRGSSM
jgi:hypothetical protein